METGSAITWKYPSCILKGDESVGEFYSVAVTTNHQQADTGTKMIHLGRNSRSTIVSKGISAGESQNSYRGLVRVAKDADGCRNFTQCDSLLMGNKCGAHTFPYIDVRNPASTVEHEATTSKINETQLFYCQQRGIPLEEAVALIVNGYAKEVMNKLPMEFAVEAAKTSPDHPGGERRVSKKQHMNERTVIIDQADPRTFYGVNNSNISLIRNLFPKLRMAARGNVIKVIGEDHETAVFEEKIKELERYATKFNKLTEDVIIDIIKGEPPREVNAQGSLSTGRAGAPSPPECQPSKMVGSFAKNDLTFALGRRYT